MIIHCSQKLAAKLPAIGSTPLEETSPLGSWHAHLFTLDRRQCVMFCHDATRYVLFLPGLRKDHFTELGSQWFRPLYLATLAMLGCSDTQIKKVELALGSMRFDTATDRSVQGSLRVAKLDLDSLAMSCWLNERPATIHGKWMRPGRAMLEAVAGI